MTGASATPRPLAVVVADTHLDAGGPNGPRDHRSSLPLTWLSARRCWLFACEKAAELQVPLLFAGDPFADGWPMAEPVEMFADGLHVLRDAGCEAVLIPGNHPYIGLRPGYREVMSHFEGWGVQVVRDIRTVVLASGLQVGCLPWPREAGLEVDAAGMSARELDVALADAAVGQAAALSDRLDPAQPAVLIGHATVSGAEIGTMRRGSEMQMAALISEPVLSLRRLLEGAWGYIGFGHLHRRQQLAGPDVGRGSVVMEYVGSPDRHDKSEAGDDKAVSVLYVDGGQITVEAEHTPARRIHIVSTYAQLEAAGIEPGDEVRLVPSAGEDTERLRSAAEEAGGYVVAEAAPVAEVESHQRESIPEDTPVAEAVRRWLELRHPDLDRDEIDAVVELSGALIEKGQL